MPRAWLRWACDFLQQTRRTTNGTPGDNQLSTYIVDVDHFVTADKAFAEIVNRLRPSAPVPVAEAHTAIDRTATTSAVLATIDLAATTPAVDAGPD